MKHKSLVAMLIFFSIPFLSYTQQAFTVHVIPSSITAVPATHSGAFARRNNKWIFIGGRLDGMHIMQAGQAFPTQTRNDSIFVVDPATNTRQAVSAHQLPNYMFEALCSSNMQYYQDGQYLYMIGGYGSEDSSVTWITFPSLISVDVDCLLQSVSAGTSISGCFRQIVDSNMAVTGGALDKIDSTYYLVFGHRFDGRYSNVASPLFTQKYTEEIRKFNINDDGVNLSISNYSSVKDTDVFHRRDFNLVPQIYPNHNFGFTVFGGVFQKHFDQPFLTPVDISAAGVQHQSTFNENLNQYTTAVLPVYDSINNYMHTIFFGGLSLYTLDTVHMSLVQDTLIPFVSTISKVTRDGVGILSESKMQENMPALTGTNSIFIPDSIMLLSNDGRIANLNSLSGNVRVGFIAGGINSDAPNVANLDPVNMSRPNAQLYEVYIDKNVNYIPEKNVTNAINNLTAFPNPVNDFFYLNFSVIKESSCEIKLYNQKGQFIKILLQSKKIKGDQQFSFSLSNQKPGIYFCNVRVGESTKVIRLVVQK